MTERNGERVGGKERRLLLAIAVHYRKHHVTPTWREAWKAAGLVGHKAYLVTVSAERHGYIASQRNVARSVRLTERGVEAAVSGFHPRPLRRRNPQIGLDSSAAGAAVATAGNKSSFTSGGRPARRVPGVSLSGGVPMNARDKGFLAAVRKAGFTAVAAPSGKSARIRPKADPKRTIAVAYFHARHLALVVKHDGRSMAVVNEDDFARGVEMLVEAAAVPAPSRGRPRVHIAVATKPAPRKRRQPK
jgi:hypothetical protein